MRQKVTSASAPYYLCETKSRLNLFPILQISITFFFIVCHHLRFSWQTGMNSHLSIPAAVCWLVDNHLWHSRSSWSSFSGALLVCCQWSLTLTDVLIIAAVASDVIRVPKLRAHGDCPSFRPPINLTTQSSDKCPFVWHPIGPMVCKSYCFNTSLVRQYIYQSLSPAAVSYHFIWFASL